MKDKFKEYCNKADLVEMNGIILKYFPHEDALSYKIMGERNYIYLEDYDNEAFKFDGEWWTIDSHNIRLKFKFYTLM